jgi:catechol 2,3-dioxygenase-like lactoylglutathione lyase family enzyme
VPGLPGLSPKFAFNAAGRVTGGVLFFCALLCAADSHIDHVTIAGRDLSKLQANLKAVGIASINGGAHNNHATEMALVSFPDGAYLELMGIQPKADPEAVSRHVWAKFLNGDAGPCAWALREKDLDAEVRRLKAAGITVSAPERSGRQRPDGVRLEWETSDVGDLLRGTFFPFLIHDFTARRDRAFPQGKPVTRDFRGVSHVVIAVKNLDDAIKRYHAAYDAPPPIKQADKDWGAYLALLGNVPVILAQPLNADSWLNARLAEFGEGPCAFILDAANPGHYKTAARSRWFGAQVSWFDPTQLGWRLGLQ